MCTAVARLHCANKNVSSSPLSSSDANSKQRYVPVSAGRDAVVVRGVQPSGVGHVQQRLVLLVQQAPHTQGLR